MIKASIIIATYNMEKQIKNAIRSILSQTEPAFELIIVDDASTDHTKEIIAQIKDKRIIYVKNPHNLGKSLSRNKAVKIARSNYIFFTDADCRVDKKWIQEGLKLLKEKDCVGVEGKIYYVSKQYQPTYSDRVVQNLSGGEYMTANIAYKKNVLLKVKLFDKRFERNQDRDLALKAKEMGRIHFNKNMIVYHAISKWNPLAYFLSASWVYYRAVLLYKVHHEKYNTQFGIYEPKKLITIIFPFLLIAKLFMDKYKSKEDYILFLLIYPRIIYERLLLWKYCLKEKVFII